MCRQCYRVFCRKLGNTLFCRAAKYVWWKSNITVCFLFIFWRVRCWTLLTVRHLVKVISPVLMPQYTVWHVFHLCVGNKRQQWKYSFAGWWENLILQAFHKTIFFNAMESHQVKYIVNCEYFLTTSVLCNCEVLHNNQKWQPWDSFFQIKVHKNVEITGTNVAGNKKQRAS